MSATQDRSQQARFYFGNAMTDLSEFLPADELASYPKPQGQVDVATAFVPFKSPDTEALELRVGRIEARVDSILEARRELSFLMQDLKRLIG
jgi:hypothetical protein